MDPRNGYATLPVGALVPAAYNPNRLTDEQFVGLVDEVRRQGRVMKPIVVRAGGDDRFVPDEDGVPTFAREDAEPGRYTIVDGEHNWRAAREVGLAEVPVQVVGADALDARLQTYKRNLVGTNDRVRLGRMLVEMEHQLDANLMHGGWGGRTLAKRLGVSEGTVRNMRLYARAAELFPGDDARIAALGVREVRALVGEGEAVAREDERPPELPDLRALKRTWNKASPAGRREFLAWLADQGATADEDQP